jgi:hypothetical protein
MLLPAYSLRRLLLVVTLSGLLCLVPAMAARGYLWAIAAATALVAAIVLVVIQGVLFLVTRALGSALARRTAGAAKGEGR